MKKILLILVVLQATYFSSHSLADIYKRVDPDGRITYSNVKTDGAVRLQVGNAQSESKPKPQAPVSKPSSVQSTTKSSQYAVVNQSTQSKRDDTRKQILLDELASEKQALIKAEQDYKAGEANPEVFRRPNKDGSYSTFRNVPKFRAKMEALQAEVDRHQRNIRLLEKELYALR